MDEEKNMPKQPLFASPYKEGDELVANTPRLADLLEEPPAPPAPALPRYESPARVERAETDSAPIRTFQGDIAHAIKNQNVSVVQIALSEARKKERLESIEKENSASSGMNRIFIALSGILFFAALGIGAYLLWPHASNIPASDATVEKPIILVDSTQAIPLDNLDRNGLIDTLQKAVSGNRQSLGTVMRIMLTRVGVSGPEAAPAQTFMGLLAEGIPDTLLRSLDPQFYFGIHIFQRNEPYLILKVDSYQSAFAGMLEWEKRMPYDLADVFIAPANRATTLTSSANFRDEIVSNKDARALIDSASLQTVLVYSFVNKDTLIITTNERTLQELSDRVTKAALLK